MNKYEFFKNTRSGVHSNEKHEKTVRQIELSLVHGTKL